VRLPRLRSPDDHPVVPLARLRQFSVEEDVVEHESHRASRLEDEEGLAVVLGAGDLYAELLLLVELAQEALGSGTGGDDGVLSREVRKVLDAGVLAREQARADDEEAVGEGNLL